MLSVLSALVSLGLLTPSNINDFSLLKKQLTLKEQIILEENPVGERNRGRIVLDNLHFEFHYT